MSRNEVFADWLARSFGLDQVQYGGFPGGTVIKNTPANAGDTKDTGSIPGLRRSPGVGNGKPLHYSFFFFFQTHMYFIFYFHMKIDFKQNPKITLKVCCFFLTIDIPVYRLRSEWSL